LDLIRASSQLSPGKNKLTINIAVIIATEHFLFQAPCYKAFDGHNLQIFEINRISAPGKYFQPNLMLTNKPGAYQSEVSTYIRLGWKGPSGTNTLACYEHSQIASIKKF
jgi:hypothetical protein